MMPASGIPSAPDRTVTLDDLRIGDLLAEGGEGRVFELPLQPHLVIKRYRRPAAREFLDDLVAWPDRLTDPTLAQRVRAGHGLARGHGDRDPRRRSSGMPAAAGVLLPRAPRRFALRHRDGTTRLATLSYLTADPAHRAVAYGLSLPEPVSPERLGLVYALARVLEAFETAHPRGRPRRPVDQERAVVAPARPGGVRPRLRQLRAVRPGWPAAHPGRPAAGHDAELGRPGGAPAEPTRPWRRTGIPWP